MPKGAKKRAGLFGAGPIVPLPQKVTSRKHARRLTTQYHDITRRMAAATSEEARAACRVDLEAMGGVKAYQAASALNTALNPTSRWVMRALRQSSRASTPPMRVLEIGAVNTQLLDAEGLLVRAIDLHSLEPRIETCDFLSLAHGGTVDPATGRVQLYDAVVCSMVLNCVPNERKRFDMLVGIRSQLRRGGRAFVTIPRTCLTHSFTLSEPIFVDALASVGLRCLDEATAAKPPESAKIAYFECEATMPCAEAALRCQRSRFEARKAHRAAADTPTAVLKRKSAGASFDVDVGGHLGFGVRVPRSFVPPEGTHGRAAKDQAACRAEFLRRCAAEEARSTHTSATASLDAPSGGGGERAGGSSAATTEARMPLAVAANDEEVDVADVHAAAGATHEACRRAIANELRHEIEADRSRLDFSRWRFYPEGEGPPGTAPGTAGHAAVERRVERLPAASSGLWCHFGRELALPSADGSAQARTGWQWADRGWTQSAPMPSATARPAAERERFVTDQATHTAAERHPQDLLMVRDHVQQGPSTSQPRQKQLIVRRARRGVRMRKGRVNGRARLGLDARLWSIGSWWRYTLAAWANT